MQDIIYFEMAKGTHTPRNRYAVYAKIPWTNETAQTLQNIDWIIYIEQVDMWEIAFSNYEKFLHYFKEFRFSIPNDARNKPIFDITLRFKQMLTRIESTQYDFEFKTKPYQHQIESFEFAKTNSQFLLSDDQGLGKAAPLYSRVYTPTGWKIMGDIKVGDLVLSEKKEHWSEVTGVFPQGKKDIYEITFDDGSKVRTCDEHLWTVKDSKTRQRSKGTRTGNSWYTTTLKNIMNRMSETRFWVPMTQPVEFAKQQLDIDPYLLGLLIGDGGISSGSVYLTSADREIVDWVSNNLPEKHYLKHYEKYMYGISGPNSGKGSNQIINGLRKYELFGHTSHTKFIPKNYLYNNSINRIALLQGLIDTDGYVSKDGTTLQYSTCSNQLALDVIELIQSLGGNARKTKWKTNKYEITINLPKDIIPCRLTRKVKRYKKRPNVWGPRRIINKVEYVGKEEAQCISVDNPTHLYLMDEFVVTHNTKQSIDIAVSRKSQFKHCLIICGVNSLKWNWEDEINTHSNEKSVILGVRKVTRGPTKGATRQRGNKEKLEDLEMKRDEFFIITNIESLRDTKIKNYLHDMIEKGEIGMTIIDEIHKALSPTSQVGKAIHALNSYYKIALTGTPLMNSPLDFYNIFVWLGEQREKTFTQFKIRYSDYDMWTNMTTYKNLPHLKARLDRIQLRRLKSDVVDLPPKVHKTEYVELDTQCNKLYYEIREKLIQEINDIFISPNPLASLIRLRQVTGYPAMFGDEFGVGAKIERFLQIIDELQEQNYKVVVFSNWTTIIDAVDELLLKKYKVGKITGNVEDNARMEAVRQFQNSDTNIILGTIGAMGTGLTLNKAEYVIFLDSPWNESNKRQAEDRAHRIGTEQTVNIITIVTKHTIDEKIEQIVYSKKAVGDYLVDGIEVPQSKNAKHYLHELLGLVEE